MTALEDRSQVCLGRSAFDTAAEARLCARIIWRYYRMKFKWVPCDACDKWHIEEVKRAEAD